MLYVNVYKVIWRFTQPLVNAQTHIIWYNNDPDRDDNAVRLWCISSVAFQIFDDFYFPFICVIHIIDTQRMYKYTVSQ